VSDAAATSYLHLFAHVALRPDPQLDLGQAALLIAEPEYPGLDVAHYVAMLDHLGEEARRRLGTGGMKQAQCLGELLYQVVGFEGNESDYYNPRNSFLNEVLDRRTGIPVTLAVVYLEVARRAGVVAQGINFPRHFLVQVSEPDGFVIVDPFTGALLERADLRRLHQRVNREDRDPEPWQLEPMTKRQILMRMLRNLVFIYRSRGDQPRLRRTLEQLSVLAPEDEAVCNELRSLGGSPYVASTPPSGSQPRN